MNVSQTLRTRMLLYFCVQIAYMGFYGGFSPSLGLLVGVSLICLLSCSILFPRAILHYQFTPASSFNLPCPTSSLPVVSYSLTDGIANGLRLLDIVEQSIHPKVWFYEDSYEGICWLRLGQVQGTQIISFLLGFLGELLSSKWY